MKHSEICPVCNGKGELADKPWTTSSICEKKTCHGCKGLGWITVGDDVYSVNGKNKSKG